MRAATDGDATLREIDVGSAKSHESGFLNCSSSRSFYITLVSHDIYYRTGQEILEQIGTPAISTKLCPANEISYQRMPAFGGRAGNKACDMLTTFAYDYRESRDTWGPARGLVHCYSNVFLNWDTNFTSEDIAPLVGLPHVNIKAHIYKSPQGQERQLRRTLEFSQGVIRWIVMICVLELVCNFFIISHLNLRPTSPHVLTLASILVSRAAIKADTWVFERVIGWVVMICVLELVYTFYIEWNRTYGLSFWCINARIYEPLNWVIESGNQSGHLSSSERWSGRLP